MSEKKGEYPNGPVRRTSSRPEPTSDIQELQRRFEQDPRFNAPSPSPWKRAALLLFLAAIFWVAFHMRKAIVVEIMKQPQVVHADRYSNEYKFRPAASPVVTEHLNNGKVRVRGAQPSLR